MAATAAGSRASVAAAGGSVSGFSVSAQLMSRTGRAQSPLKGTATCPAADAAAVCAVARHGSPVISPAVPNCAFGSETALDAAPGRLKGRPSGRSLPSVPLPSDRRLCLTHVFCKLLDATLCQ